MAALMVFPSPASGDGKCVVQDYSNPVKVPDFDCPGPGEEDLLPKLEMRPSLELELDQKAPWPGILMDTNRVLKIGLRIKAIRQLRWQELQYCGEAASAELNYTEQTYQAELDLLTSQRDNYKGQVIELRKEVEKADAWYRSPILWFSVGVIVASAGTVAAVTATR